MAIDFSLLLRICEAPGAPGFEREIRQLILADEIRPGGIGDVIALKKGRSSACSPTCVCEPDKHDWKFS